MRDGGVCGCAVPRVYANLNAGLMVGDYVLLQASSSLSSESPAPLSKLDRVKLFVELLIKTIRSDDMLSVVTFGTTARVVLPLRRMSDDAKV